MADEYSDYGSSEGVGAPGTSYSVSPENPATGGDSSSIFNTIGSILSGGSGSMAQLAGLGGLGALLNSFGGSGGGGFSGYKGSIPKYTASRSQYPIPASTTQSQYRPSNQDILAYLGRPNLTDANIAQSMNQYGVSPQRMAQVTGMALPAVNARYQAAMGPNMPARRPGSGGITYFSPMRYIPQAAPAAPVAAPSPQLPPNPVIEDRYAAGGMAQGGLGSLGHYSDGGQLLRGPGDGVSDDIPAMIGDKQPARLADGEFVVPARIVSELGNGSTEAGARKLYAMMDRIKKARSKSMKNIAANSKADKHLPA